MGIKVPEIGGTKPSNDGFPKEGFGNLNAPPGYGWTDKWEHGPTIRRDQIQRMRANEAGRVGWQEGSPVYNPPGAPDISYTENTVPGLSYC